MLPRPRAPHPRTIALGLALGLCLAAGVASAQFVDETQTSGLTWFQTTWGAAFADFNGDGTLDLYAGHHFFDPTLYWNHGLADFDPNLYSQPWSGPVDRHGVLAVSVNNDDRTDIFIAHGGAGGAGSEANELFRNDGGGVFISTFQASGMDDPPGRTRCASAADFDGDFRLDIWVGKAPSAQSRNSLFRNVGEFVFNDVAASVGLDEPYGTVGGIWGDYDDDGDPDLFVGGEEFPRPSILHRNDGGTFSDASSIFTPALPVVSGADWGDMDNDGDLDLAVCDGEIGIFDIFTEGDSVSFFFNTRYGDTGLDGITVPSTADTCFGLFRVRAFADPDLVFLGPSGVHPPPVSNVTLTDAYVGAPAFTPGVDRGIYVWRVAPGGDWEIRGSTPQLNFDTFDGWIADGAPITGVVAVDLEDPGFTSGGPRVWRNDGGAFMEITSALGLPAAMVNPRDISWVDYDNDGDLDLHVVDMGTSADPNAPDALFRNDGGSFADVTVLEGVAGGSAGLGDGGVWGDADGDGDLDLFLLEGAGPASFSAFGPALFLVNKGQRGSSIQVDLVGRNSGVTAMGAKVTAVVGTTRITRRVTANSWRGFMDPTRIHIGIGSAVYADSLVVEWPSGTVHNYVHVLGGIYRLNEDTIALGAALPPRRDAGWRIESVRPQPARGLQTLLLALERAADLEISVHDVAGRRIRTLHRGPLPAGPTPFSWNGRDASGRAVSAGVYFFRVTDGESRVSEKSVRIR